MPTVLGCAVVWDHRPRPRRAAEVGRGASAGPPDHRHDRLERRRGRCYGDAVTTFGAVCREVRIARQLSQIQVAAAAGLHQSRVSEIERDTYAPGLDQARKLAGGLGVPLSDLLAVCEGTLTVAALTRALDLPRGVSLVARRRRTQAPGQEMTERARRLGFEVLRVVHDVMQARLTPETRGRKPRARAKASSTRR